MPALCHGFAADIGSSGASGAHSTFHYELTRALAIQAGYSQQHAELLATVNEAVDATDFTGDGCPLAQYRVEIRGTERLHNDNETRFFHFPRREDKAYYDDTCHYFDSVDPVEAVPENAPCGLCGGHYGELDQIAAWASGDATGLCSAGVPRILVDRTSRFQPMSFIQPGSVAALGVYLHSLGDSFSHELCMELSQWRSHTVAPQEQDSSCDFAWHDETFGAGEEYGCTDQPGIPPVSERGVPTTRAAGKAIYEALLESRSSSCDDLRGATDCATIDAFVDAFACETDPEVRRQMANDLAGLTCAP